MTGNVFKNCSVKILNFLEYGVSLKLIIFSSSKTLRTI